MAQKRCIVSLVLLMLPAGVAALYTVPHYWEPSISRALISRDEMYRQAGLALNPLQFDFLLDKTSVRLFEERILATGRVDSPWYYLLLGLCASQSDTAEATRFFSQALSLCSESPGMSWVLFIEFRRAGQYQWSENCLRQLEAILLCEGAESAPIVAQQLLALGRDELRRGNRAQALRYCDWSAHFDRDGVWQALVKASWTTPLRPLPFLKACIECWARFMDSWWTQAGFAFTLYRIFRNALALFAAVVFLIVSAKAIVPLFTAWSGLFPRGVPAVMRMVLSSLVFAALAMLGFVPFVLIAAVLYWRHLDGQDRVFLAVCLACTLLMGLDTRINGAFIRALSPDSSLSLFRRANDEGYSQELEANIRAYLAAHGDDYLARIALSNVLRKISDVKLSRAHMTAARRMNGRDPVVLAASGNSYYAGGNYDKAAEYYRAAIKAYPSYPDAYYNYLACMRRTGAAIDSGLIDTIAALSTGRIRAFSQSNYRYFGDTIPAIRQVIQPDYPAWYFWTHVMPELSGIHRQFTAWHMRLIRRLPSLLSAMSAIGIVIVAAVFIRTFLRKRRIDSREKDGAMRIVMKDARYLRRQKKYLIYVPAALDCLFPGAGALLRTSRDVRGTMMLMAIAACAYAVYVAFFTLSFSYPFWIIRPYLLGVVALFALFHAVRMARSVRAALQELSD